MTATSWHGGELRQDPLTGDWSVLAPHRARRPHTGAVGCPFCPGPSEDTPPETWRLPAPGGGWLVRSVRNRYALSDHHEVIIESPRHDWDLATGTDAEAANVLLAWRDRLRALRTDAAQVVVFRNRGAAAGTSLDHPHSQVVGLPVLSASARRELSAQRERYERQGRPYTGEVSDTSRVVLDDGQTVAFAPFAPTAEFEVRVAPRRPAADFAGVSTGELTSAAATVRAMLRALRDELGDPPYNLFLHTAPSGLEHAPWLCWSMRIVPRLAVPAGLELATGIPVVTTMPEDAARRLRARAAIPAVPPA
ncbi:galactose-1-phosphate uridylyltransferase [Amycolatopsis tucumanensis]|uniref:galactose-1-phosphate uridylyltransferase n=1 Tax=Amycolatopsis tucumanensis TaxID=401106 RepID=UPI003D71475B